MFIDKFLKIGFTQLGREIWHGAGWGRTYKYQPDYFVDKHYTLILFTFGEDSSITDKSEYRLYTHSNKDGKCVDIIFQLSYESDWRKNYLGSKFDEVFKSELRNSNLERILNG